MCIRDRLEKLALAAKPFQCFIDPDAPEFVPQGDLPGRVREDVYKRQESDIAWRTGPIVLSTKSAVSSLNLARVRVASKCFGPVARCV